MRRLWNLFSTFAALAIFSTAIVTVPQTPLQAQKGGGKGTLNAKNVKVLPPDTVAITMQNITLALGKPCTFCHVEGNFPADTKPQKLKARMMMEMVRDINGKFGDGQTHVTCWTCHRASTQPPIAKPAAN